MWKKAVLTILMVTLFIVPKQARAGEEPFEESYPVLSPNGTQMVFVSNRGGVEDLYVVAPDGSGDATRLNVNESADAYIGRPSWSPNGHAISFILYENREGYDYKGNLCVYGFDTQETFCPEKLRYISMIQEWGPYNIALVMDGGPTCNGLHLVFLDPMTFKIVKYVGSWYEGFSWADNGLLLASNSCDGVGDWQVLNSHGDLVTTLSQTSATWTNPSWAPHSSLLSYTANNDGGYLTHILDVSTGSEKTVDLVPDGEDPLTVSWSPDHKKLAFLQYDKYLESRELFYFDLKTGELYQIPIADSRWYSPLVWVNNETLVLSGQNSPLLWLSITDAIALP